MGWFWEWVAGHARSMTQEAMASAIQATVETATEGKIRLVNVETFQIRTYKLFTVLVSPEKDGWSAFWSMSHVLPYSVFRMQRLSGMYFHGFDDRHDASWDYIRWEDGEISDWFISNPHYYFELIAPGVFEAMAAPYLQSIGRVGEIAGQDEMDAIRHLAAANAYADVWSGNIDHIREFLKPSVDEDAVREWLAPPTTPGIFKLPEIFDIPFVGPDYNLMDMSAFLAYQWGIPGYENPVLRAIEPDIDLERRGERSAEWKEHVSGFRPMLFLPAEGEDSNRDIAEFLLF